MLIDTHAHIHFDEFRNTLESVFENAKSSNVVSIITVGTNEEDSLKALEFINNQDTLKLSDGIGLYATTGIHPHDAGRGKAGYSKLEELVYNHSSKDSIKAIGECGLDYFKGYSSKSEQFEMLELHLSLAKTLSLPVVFHVRDAWDDFFAILKNHPDTRGVIHSFTGYPEHVELAVSHGLYFGINGIMTFTKDQKQLDALKTMPDELMLLETDCPYLAPAPFRGKPNQPSYITEIAQFVAKATDNNIEYICNSTSQNAKELFAL